VEIDGFDIEVHVTNSSERQRHESLIHCTHFTPHKSFIFDVDMCIMSSNRLNYDSFA
jgi:hypothetical protein